VSGRNEVAVEEFEGFETLEAENTFLLYAATRKSKALNGVILERGTAGPALGCIGKQEALEH
jgi:hypothetical protein